MSARRIERFAGRVPPATVVLCAAALSGVLASCHPRQREESATEDPDDDVTALPPAAAVDAGASAGPAMPPCALEPTRWLARDVSARPVPTLEGGALARGPGGDWVGWVDRAPPGALVLSPPSGEPLRAPLGAGDTEAPTLAASGDGVVAVSVVSRGTARTHRVLAASGGALHELFQQREAADDGLTVAVAATSQGVIIAWDEERPHKGAVVLSQFVPHALAARGAAASPPAPRAISPEDQDAADPMLLALPDGSVLLAWLAAQDDVDPEGEGNVTASNIVVRRLGPTGESAGPPVVVTPGPGRRFGVAASPGAGGNVWLAYRVSGDADQESRGDGGSVAALKLGPDLHPLTSPVFVTEPGAAASGAPVVLPAGDGAEVFWAEHNGDGLRTLRRLLRANATPAAPPQAEPALAGDVPAHGDASAVTVVIHGPQGELGVARGQCPTTLAAPTPVAPTPAAPVPGPPRAAPARPVRP